MPLNHSLFMSTVVPWGRAMKDRLVLQPCFHLALHLQFHTGDKHIKLDIMKMSTLLKLQIATYENSTIPPPPPPTKEKAINL